jgi:hypothetical protein
MLAKPKLALSMDAMTEKRKQKGSNTLQHDAKQFHNIEL